MQVKQHFARRLPQVEVTGSNYPAPWHKQLIAQIGGVVQMAGFVVVPFGDKLCALLGAPVPPFYAESVAPNKMKWFGALWLGGNFAQGMVATGAFEVVINGNDKAPVFSKLREGRMPTLVIRPCHAPSHLHTYSTRRKLIPNTLPCLPAHLRVFHTCTRL
jgi:selT/selW/selH-like putative selenoprotein